LIGRGTGGSKCWAPGVVDELALNQALARVMEVVGEINGYLERTTPWQEAKANRPLRTATILYTACEALRLVSVLLQPVLPERTAALWRRLGLSRAQRGEWQPPAHLGDALIWGELPPGAEVVAGPPLFPREVGS
jgi:methionyl-tRNA synthetase